MVNPCVVIDSKVRKELKWVHKNMDEIKSHLKLVEKPSLDQINDTKDWLYYRYLTAMMKALRPKQVIELGSAAGVGVLMMMPTLPKNSQLLACSIPEPEHEFRYIPRDKYDNLTLIHGNDLDLDIWEGEDIGDTDIWFIDTEHHYDQLSSELSLYDPYFKQGTIILLDDIDLNDGMKKAWKEIKYPKLSLPDLHHSGFGMFYVDRKT